ncbi:MAG: hypothetical protein AB1813_21075, partial [Verrucomicrobiota bacterium]
FHTPPRRRPNTRPAPTIVQKLFQVSRAIRLQGFPAIENSGEPLWFLCDQIERQYDREGHLSILAILGGLSSKRINALVMKSLASFSLILLIIVFIRAAETALPANDFALLGAGYKTLEGRFASDTAWTNFHPVPKGVAGTQYDVYVAESFAALQESLDSRGAFGVAGTLPPASLSGSLKGNFQNIKDHTSKRYSYHVVFRAICVADSMTIAGHVGQLTEAAEKLKGDPCKFYAQFGDSYVQSIITGTALYFVYSFTEENEADYVAAVRDLEATVASPFLAAKSQTGVKEIHSKVTGRKGWTLNYVTHMKPGSDFVVDIKDFWKTAQDFERTARKHAVIASYERVPYSGFGIVSLGRRLNDASSFVKRAENGLFALEAIERRMDLILKYRFLYKEGIPQIKSMFVAERKAVQKCQKALGGALLAVSHDPCTPIPDIAADEKEIERLKNLPTPMENAKIPVKIEAVLVRASNLGTRRTVARPSSDALFSREFISDPFDYY